VRLDTLILQGRSTPKRHRSRAALARGPRGNNLDPNLCTPLAYVIFCVSHSLSHTHSTKRGLALRQASYRAASDRQARGEPQRSVWRPENPASKNAPYNKVHRQQDKLEEERVLSARRMLAVNAPGAEAALATALGCKAGKLAFPVLAEQLALAELTEALARAVEGSILLLGTDGRGKKKRSKDKGPFVAWLDFHCGGLSPAQVSAMGISPEYLRKARQLRNDQSIPPIPAFFETKYTVAHRDPLRMPDPLMCALVAFFSCYSFVLSGAVRPTRHLVLAMHELFACLHGRWPAILRRLVLDHPELRIVQKRKMTKLQEDIKIAQALAQHPDFDELREFTDRYEQYESKYAQRLASARLKAGKLVVPPPSGAPPCLE
jgi:hypothetical protein